MTGTIEHGDVDPGLLGDYGMWIPRWFPRLIGELWQHVLGRRKDDGNGGGHRNSFTLYITPWYVEFRLPHQSLTWRSDSFSPLFPRLAYPAS